MALGGLHQRYLISKVDLFLTVCLKDPDSAHCLKDENLKAKIGSAYNMDLSADADDGGDSDGDDSA